MRILPLLTLALMLPLSTSVMAQVEDPILAMPDGQAILNISATERREVEQDLLVATLAFKTENTNARTAQNDINKKMKDASLKPVVAVNCEMQASGRRKIFVNVIKCA